MLRNRNMYWFLAAMPWAVVMLLVKLSLMTPDLFVALFVVYYVYRQIIDNVRLKQLGFKPEYFNPFITYKHFAVIYFMRG